MGMGGLVLSFVYMSKCLSICLCLSLCLYIFISLCLCLALCLYVLLSIVKKVKKTKKTRKSTEKMAKNGQNRSKIVIFGQKVSLYQVMRTFQNVSR